MPYPLPDDPDYCPSSRELIPNYNSNKQWHRCPTCQRPICAMGLTKRFFPHVRNIKRARRGDAVQEGLIHFDMNRRERWTLGPVRYTEPEEIFGPVDIASLKGAVT